MGLSVAVEAMPKRRYIDLVRVPQRLTQLNYKSLSASVPGFRWQCIGLPWAAATQPEAVARPATYTATVE